MADTEAAVPAFKKRSKKNTRKRPTAQKGSDSSDEFSSEDENGGRIKRRKKTAIVTASSKDCGSDDKDLATTVFSADRNAALNKSNDATKHSNWYDEDITKGTLPQDKTRDSALASAPNGIYKGLANQASFIQKNPNAPDRKFGPIKAPTNIRTITITDFAPDVCKDYKQTGFCGFGDNCKFLHAREDYKQGWQMDREWENVNKGKKSMQGTVISSANRGSVTGGAEDEDGDTEEAMLEKIPFACIICKGDYREPVVTRCGHYFCESCALKRYRKDPTCAACRTGTNGVFNSAKRLKKLLERKQERAEKRRQAAIEAGEDITEGKEE